MCTQGVIHLNNTAVKGRGRAGGAGGPGPRWEVVALRTQAVNVDSEKCGLSVRRAGLTGLTPRPPYRPSVVPSSAMCLASCRRTSTCPGVRAPSLWGCGGAKAASRSAPRAPDSVSQNWADLDGIQSREMGSQPSSADPHVWTQGSRNT